MWLTLLALRNGIAILMASLAIVVLEATSLARRPIDLFPDINNYPPIRIGTIYQGANVQDIERTVTCPIEKAVSSPWPSASMSAARPTRPWPAP
jgi:multidrug efflux pump subunit AcrB